MRKVILQEFVTLGGFAAGPGGDVDWLPAATRDDGFDRHQLDFSRSIDTILLGRVTYDLFAAYWPNATMDDDMAADTLNHAPKLVFSSTLERAPWGTYPEATVVKGSAADAIRRLKQQPGKDMVMWGSISLRDTRTFELGEVELTYE